eukprot:823967-Rhodomonas_salina.3
MSATGFAQEAGSSSPLNVPPVHSRKALFHQLAAHARPQYQAWHSTRRGRHHTSRIARTCSAMSSTFASTWQQKKCCEYRT